MVKEIAIEVVLADIKKMKNYITPADKIMVCSKISKPGAQLTIVKLDHYLNGHISGGTTATNEMARKLCKALSICAEATKIRESDVEKKLQAL